MAKRKMMVGISAAVDMGTRDEIEIRATGPDLVVGLPPHDKMDFEGMIAKGENPNGFTAQTANGTAHAMGTGWNRVRNWSSPQIEPDPTRPAGRSNRTGE